MGSSDGPCALYDAHSAHDHMSICFVFNDTATTEIYTLSLHDAFPISQTHTHTAQPPPLVPQKQIFITDEKRSEEHTSELQSHLNLVCRLLLDTNKEEHTNTHALKYTYTHTYNTHTHTCV